MSSGTAGRPGRKAYWLISVFALALVLFPFLFWYYTWFGRKLSDSDLDQYFADASKPRHAQHALAQLGERLSRHQDVTRWYPNVIRQAASPSLELRQTAAWIMGQDSSYAPFHDALLGLLHDSHPGLRIVKEAQESVVKRGIARVLPHDPGSRLAEFQAGARGLPDHVGVPARDILMAGEAFAEVHQRVLGMTGLGGVGEVLVQIGIGELAAEPGVIPEKEREQDQGEREYRDQPICFAAGAAGGA